ncbi:MAG: hypothetical protein ACHWZW_22980 [Spirulina sp.]
MKRVLMSGLFVVLSSLTMAAAANAEMSSSMGQTTLHDAAADLNGDGVVTLSELVRYNREQRQA